MNECEYEWMCPLWVLPQQLKEDTFQISHEMIQEQDKSIELNSQGFIVKLIDVDFTKPKWHRLKIFTVWG